MMLWDDGPRRKPASRHEKEALYAKQKGKCMYCGRKLLMADMHLDHKRPLANGGGEALSNKQMLCAPCNTRKGAMSDADFRKIFKLAPSRQADGPPAKPIAISHFESIAKEVKKKKTTTRRKADEWSWF